MKVVDASAMIELLSWTSKAPSLELLLDDELFAPDLLVAEVIHHFRYLLRGEQITAGVADAAVGLFNDADIQYTAVWPLADRIWELRENMSAYDACYVALAEDLRCPLVTTDKKLASTPTSRTTIISV